MNSWASVRQSVVFDGVQVMRNATIVNAIIDKHAVIEEGASVGVDHDRDRERGLAFTEGITVVPKGMRVPK